MQRYHHAEWHQGKKRFNISKISKMPSIAMPSLLDKDNELVSGSLLVPKDDLSAV